MLELVGSIKESEVLNVSMSGGKILLTANIAERGELSGSLVLDMLFISEVDNLEIINSNLVLDIALTSEIKELEVVSGNIEGVVNFVVNKQGLLINGVEQSVGTILTMADLAGRWRNLLAAGRIKRVGQFSKDAFRSGQRFKKYSKYTYPP